MFRRHPLLGLATVAYLGVVGWVTLGPQPFSGGNSAVERILAITGRYPATEWVSYSRLEFGANVAMFVPIGVFFLLLCGRSLWWLAAALPVAMTLLIETSQLFIPGRVSDIRDIVANSLGGLIGVVLALILTASKAHRAPPRVAAAR